MGGTVYANGFLFERPCHRRFLGASLIPKGYRIAKKSEIEKIFSHKFLPKVNHESDINTYRNALGFEYSVDNHSNNPISFYTYENTNIYDEQTYFPIFLKNYYISKSYDNILFYASSNISDLEYFNNWGSYYLLVKMTDEEKQVAYLRKYLEKDKLEEGIALLKKGIPVQYIVGNVDFYGNIIRVDKNVLIPRFETELLVDKTIKRINKYFNNKLIRILELGTGSGCIAISLKKEINSIIDAIDISKEALSVAIDNAKINNVDINFMLADMTTYKDKKYDVIISNPPYIKEDELIMDMVKDNEPNIALYADDNGLYYYKKIIDNINYLTNDKYLICFEIGYTQGKYIEEYAKDNLSDITVSIEKDYNDRDRFIFITNIK